jgi:dTDP-4-dehydrorhamnose reductase
VILVVGTDGLIGGALCRFLAEAGETVVGTSRKQRRDAFFLDLEQPESFALPQNVRTAVICAGVGGLRECSDDPAGTSRINVEGAAVIAQKIAAAGGSVIALSTNLVTVGRQPFATTGEFLEPCCEYGRQKARMEKMLKGPQFACVRLTKVVETLGPRFAAWKESLLAGRNVSASPDLLFSPVPLVEVCVALAELARNFQSGTFHISGDRDFSYFDATRRLASVLGVSESLVHADKLGGLDLFDPVPKFGTLGIVAPAYCSRWRFLPSSDTLTGFLTSL